MSAKVSESGGELFTRLVEWEVLGRKEVDPKILLRSITLADLAGASKNLDALGGLGEFVVSQMVEMELLYREGKIVDWNYERNGDHVRFMIQKKGNVDYVKVDFEVRAA